MSDELLKIHGNCEYYKFQQSRPARDGCCVMGEIKYFMCPLDEGCDCFTEVRK